VQQDKEQKIFLSILWTFLLGSLTFFVFRLSFARIVLPAPIWYMLLLLDAGFIIFTFIPHPGWGVPGVAGRHEETIREHAWYPQNLSEIVEGRGDAVDERREGVRPPSRAVPPVPLIPLVLLLICIALAYPHVPDLKNWQSKEAERLRSVYGKTENEFLRLEALASQLEERAGATIDWGTAMSMAPGERVALIQKIDSLVKSVRLDWAPFPEVGIQIYVPTGERLAWGGSPRYFDAVEPGSPGGVRVFTSRTPLYTLLVSAKNIPGEGSIVVDVPLEVNYRINNRFLRSRSLGEVLSRRYGDEIEFNFSIGEHRGFIGWNDRGVARDSMRVISGPNAGVQVIGVVHASTGVPLARLKVLGDPLPAVVEQMEAKRAVWAGFLISIAVIAITVWVYRTYYRKVAREGTRVRVLAQRLLVLVAFIIAIRFLLLRLDIPGALLRVSIFDPAFFADDFPGGFLRNAGEFLVTSVFALILVFGSIKAFRTYYTGYLERPLAGAGRFSVSLFAAKAALLFGTLAGALSLSSNIVSRTVLNASLRLVGFDVNFLDMPILALHFSLLFTVSAVLIAAIFIVRLVLTGGGGRMREGLAASLAALAGLAILYSPHWPLLCVAGALVALSFRIFPLLKKEETVSIIFVSFFLVLICSLAVFAISSERYTGLRKNYVREKIDEFSKPEENWLQFYVPNICMDISNDQSVALRLLSKKESTAFELWAESSLSRSGYSCVFGMYDAAGTLLSKFAVGMSFDLPRRRPAYELLSRGPFVESLRAETRGGAVFYYSGYAPIFRMRGDLLGWIEITIPYFFENPELLARTGRMAPEILQNIERGTAVRRSDEPEKQLVARVSGNRVKRASDAALRAGSALPAHEGEWLLLRVGRGRYNCSVKLDENGEGYLVGYRVASVGENLLQWATVVSLEVILALVSLLVLFVLRRLPVLKGVVPDVSPARGLGFRQKVLLSFLLVSMLPVMILGAFSSQVIAQRFRAEEENKALSGAHAAASLMDHSIRTEAASLAGGQYIGELLASEGKGDVSGEAGIDKRRFTIIGSDGEELYGSAVAGLTMEQRSELLASVNIDRVTVSYEAPILYGGVVVPIVAHGSRGGYLYYRRALDDDFVKSVAVALGPGTEINIYYDALLRASSERELFVGGFLDPICEPSVFVDIALQGNSATVLRETLGDYSYYVASAPLQSFGGAASGVLSVPMLYQPGPMQEEVRKTPMLILGLLALLFVATVTLGVFLAGKIFNPIAALQGGTRKIIEGELEFKLEAEAPDEIGELVDSFNTMTAALREARRGLLERQRYLSAVLDNIATGVMATGSDGAIITINPAGERMLRVFAADVIGKKPRDVFGEGRTPLLDLFSVGGEEVREVEITLFSGEMARIVKAVVASLVEGGERLGTLVVFDDLTELIRSKKLAAWVEMARQIAHEVKNPLTPIKLSAQLMKKAFESGSGDFDGIFKSGVDTVIQQTEILHRIASEFSNFGKAMRMSPETIPLAEFLGEIISYYRGAEDVAMSLSCEDGLAVRADREALRKILVNLMENAIEASSNGGEISVASRREGSNAIISVVDSGKGLSPEMEGRLFEPYFSTKSNGIGLGLAISQSLARAMEGEVRLRNREGTRGVEAAVILPLEKEE
jgi:signal transduction histidine kinase